MSAPKYCPEPDACTYSDCPTAFCDRDGSTHSLQRPCSAAAWKMLALRMADEIMDSKIETTQQQPAPPAVASKDGLAGTDLVGSLEKVYFAAVEFLNDWTKGDFELPSLAQHDANALKEACLRYESDKATFLKFCHATIDAHRPANHPDQRPGTRMNTT